MRQGQLATNLIAFSSSLLASMFFAAAPGFASDAWTEIRASVFGSKPIQDGRGIIALKAPTRPEDMRVVPIGVSAGLDDGRTIKSISLIIDENPTPVVAVYRPGDGRDTLNVTANFRVDRQSELRAIVEASDGALYMVSQLVKFAGGQSSCAAPPTGDPVEIAASMGRMQLAIVAPPSTAAASTLFGAAKLELRHPNHTGMVMDQITLLYTPMKMVSEISVRAEDQLVLNVEGSIALSQDPKLEFDFKKPAPREMTVTFKDTDDGVWKQSFPIGPQS